MLLFHAGFVKKPAIPYLFFNGSTPMSCQNHEPTFSHTNAAESFLLMKNFTRILKSTSVIWIAISFCLSFTNTYAQGDDPCTAAAITPVSGATCTPGTIYSLAGLTSTTAAAAPVPGCASYLSPDTEDGWFKFTTASVQNIEVCQFGRTLFCK